jgi:hypothetical protein
LDLQLNIGSPPVKQGKFRANDAENQRFFGVLDLAFAWIVNDGSRAAVDDIEAAAKGAIAQLGERVVRNDEVGGSIPPGSTSLRSLRELRLGKPEKPTAAKRAKAAAA